MGLSVGEDLFAVLAVLCLAALSLSAFLSFHQALAEREGAGEDFDLALAIANKLRNDVLARFDNRLELGLINPKAFENSLPAYAELLAKQGIELRVEVRKLSGELVLAYGKEKASPPTSVSLPVAVATSHSSKPLGELTVKVWRG